MRDLRIRHYPNIVGINQSDTEHQQGDENREYRPAPYEGTFNQPTIGAVNEAQEAAIEFCAPARWLNRAKACVRQVSGQDQFGLDQAEHQTQDNHHGDIVEKRAFRATAQGERCEHRNGGEYAKGRRGGDPLCAADNIVGAAAFIFDFGVRTFADNNGVIHHNPQHHDECK